MTLSASIILFIAGTIFFIVIALVKAGCGDTIKKIHPLIYMLVGFALCFITYPPDSLKETPQFGERAFTAFITFMITCILTTVSGQKRKEDD